MDGKIKVSENSLLTMEEVSKIFDDLFLCGAKTPTKERSWVDGKEVEAFYYDCTQEEAYKHLREVFADTPYEEVGIKGVKTFDVLGFKEDFLKWRNLGWKIKQEGQKRTGEFLPLDEFPEENKYLENKEKRRVLWDRIRTVFEQKELREQGLRLPQELDTEQARKYFARAIEAGFMRKEGNGYKWLYGGDRGQIRLGYFCGKVFEVPRPIRRLEEVFGAYKLSSLIFQSGYEPKTRGAMEWRRWIDDKIFHDKTIVNS